tara:strand:- start:895 stop:1149 length:255 start_codon:yes stop_codon:yes gene_type:complete
MKMTTIMYNDLETDVCLDLLGKEGVLVDEVIIFGILKMKLYNLNSFYVQVVHNKSDDVLLDIKALITDEDWNPFLETLDIKSFF